MKPAVSIIGIKKTIKQHTADVDITDSVDYKISAPPRFYNRYLNLVCYNPYRPNTVIYSYHRIESIRRQTLLGGKSPRI
jgi:hypothetical protein